MLKKCPECELQVSDKAVVCPHCGYPISGQPIVPKPRSSTKRKRLPNGFGRITELKNQNLRNRFRAMITVGTAPNGRPVGKLLKPTAYFRTYNEAYAALVEYNKNPYDLNTVMTMQELYEKWSEEYFPKATQGGVRGFKAAWDYCSSVYNMRVKDLRARHIKGCIENGTAVRKGEVKTPSANHKTKIKSLFNMMLDYAVEYELVDRNYARTFALDEDVLREAEDDKVPHIAFTADEMEKLWEHEEDIAYVDYVIFQCYSGFRPQELGIIMLTDVNLNEGYIKSGMKTDAGKDRIVPIHPRVLNIVEREYNKAKAHKSFWLFSYYDVDRVGSPKLTYTRYRSIFHRIIKQLGLNEEHKPHDPRKTFVTMAKNSKMDEYAIKQIVGHEITDITEKTYTERPTSWYIEEMKKIK